MMKQIKDKIIDIVAIIVAVVALLLTYKQGNLQADLSRAAWQPHLFIEFIKTDSQPTKGFFLKNGGNGPALIESFKYYKNESDFQKKVFHREWLNSTGKSRAVLLGFKFEDINNLTRGSVISKEADNGLFLLGTQALDFYGSQTAQSMDSAIIEIEYKSLAKADDRLYFLRFCEKFASNNVTDSTAKNIYESGS